jgi:aminoglycoside phosphotransferase
VIAGGQILHALRHYMGDAVPSPEIYGWRTDGDDVFLYIQVIDGGITLEQAWPAMIEEDRVRLCRELRTMFDTMRRLKQDTNGIFIGMRIIAISRSTS